MLVLLLRSWFLCLQTPIIWVCFVFFEIPHLQGMKISHKILPTAYFSQVFLLRVLFSFFNREQQRNQHLGHRSAYRQWGVHIFQYPQLKIQGIQFCVLSIQAHISIKNYTCHVQDKVCMNLSCFSALSRLLYFFVIQTNLHFLLNSITTHN